MPWVHRTTKQYIPRSSPTGMAHRFAPLVFVDGTGKPVSNAGWIYDGENFPAVTGIDPKYWDISGDTVSPMTRVQMDVVDAKEATDQQKARDFADNEIYDAYERARLRRV